MDDVIKFLANQMNDWPDWLKAASYVALIGQGVLAIIEYSLRAVLWFLERN